MHVFESNILRRINHDMPHIEMHLIAFAFGIAALYVFGYFECRVKNVDKLLRLLETLNKVQIISVK